MKEKKELILVWDLYQLNVFVDPREILQLFFKPGTTFQLNKPYFGIDQVEG